MDSHNKSGKLGFRRQRQSLFILSLVIILLAGLLFIAYTYLHYIHRSKTEAINLAQAFEAFVGLEIIDELEASAADLHKPAYLALKDELTQFISRNDKIRFAYLFVYRDGHVYFLADSEPQDSPAYSPPGEELIGFSDQDLNQLREGKAIITPLVKDKWGTWVTITVPVVNPRNGQVEAAFGVDYPAFQWYAEPLRNTGYSAALVIGLLLSFIAYYRKTISNEILRQERDKLEMMTRKISESEELFRRVFEKAPIGIAIVNSFRFISIMNLQFEKIVGRTPAELAAIDWTEMTHPDDLQGDLRKFEHFKAGHIDGYEMNKRFIKLDGTTVWVKMIIAPLTFNETSLVEEHLCLIEDITEKIKVSRELKESERSKYVLLQNLPGMAYRCNYDREWTMQFVSEGCLKLTGYKPESLLHNRDLSFNEVISPQYREFVWEEWRRVVQAKTVFKAEYQIITAEGECKWVYEQGQPIYDQNGNVKALEGLIIDINDRKMIEQEILYLNNHDYLTGLYNRRYFEEEKQRLDHEDNLPN